MTKIDKIEIKLDEIFVKIKELFEQYADEIYSQQYYDNLETFCKNLREFGETTFLEVCQEQILEYRKKKNNNL